MNSVFLLTHGDWPKWGQALQSPSLEFTANLGSFDNLIEGFIYYYPLFMAYIWMFGAVIFYFRFEWRKHGNAEHLPELSSFPPVSVLIPQGC
jgi:poly-beta-1,6-N-acetyl-D-glucosamine synthase